MYRYFRFLILFAIFFLVYGCATLPETTQQVNSSQTTPPTQILIPTPISESHSTPTNAINETPTPTLDKEVHDCSTVERLPTDSAEAQQILNEFISNYKVQYPTEYMDMMVLHSVDRLGEWAIITGSIAGEGKDVIAVRQTSSGYQIADFIHVVPFESPEELEKRAIQPLSKKLPEAPQELFTCLDQDWLLASGFAIEPPAVFQLAYVGTDNNDTTGVTEIDSLQSDGSKPSSILSKQMLIMDLVSSPDGKQIAFWGCPGSLSSDCFSDEDLHVWVIGWDGTGLRNLTETSLENASHPDWSPDGEKIVFQSEQSDRADIYIMDVDGSDLQKITDGQGYNREPKWSPDGKWIAYHCTQGSGIEMQTRMCVISPDGLPAGEPIAGIDPTWSQIGADGEIHLAFRCLGQGGQDDICIALASGSGLINLTTNPYVEYSPVWSPDGEFVAFESNRSGDFDLYKICINCSQEHIAIRLSHEIDGIGSPIWSPDGQLIAYKVASKDLKIVNADGSDSTYLTGGVFGPAIWRP